MSNNTYNPINDALNIRQRPESHVNFTTFNRSYPFVGTGSLGQIIPFFFDETMPGDFWKISGEYLFRFAPMYLPIFSQVKVYVDYYYVPIRLLWGLSKKDVVSDGLEEFWGWETFISSFDDSLTFPYMNVPMGKYEGVTDEMISFLGIPTDEEGIVTDGILQVNPLPFLAILHIYDQYIRNDQVQDQRSFRWFESMNGDPGYTLLTEKYDQYGQLNVTGLPIIAKLRRNWDNDYFTVMTPTPQLGANVLVPMINDLEDFWQADLGVATETTSYPSRWRRLVGGAQAAAGEVDIVSTPATGASLTQDDSALYMGLDIQETAASILQLRRNLQLQEILERAMRTGDKYNDYLFKFHDEDIDPLQLDIPQWFGGHQGRVVVSDVFATANTTGDTATTVGSYSGMAVSVDKVKRAQIKVKEHGYIFGLLSVIPESQYQNGLHPLWTRQKWYDFTWEQFGGIGDRPIKRMEMQLILAPPVPTADYINNYAENQEVIGYLPRDHEMRYRTALVAGQMRTLWESYHLGRIFGQAAGDGIVLGDELLVCVPRIFDVFKITEGLEPPYKEEEIHILVHNTAYVDRRLSKYAVPTT